MNNWDIEDWGVIEETPDKLIKDNIRFEKFKQKQLLTVKELNDLEIGLPDKKTQIRIITQKRFNAISLLDYICQKVIPEEIILTTYRIDKQSIRKLTEIINENINITIICSAFFTSVKKEEPWAQELISIAENNKNYKLIFCHNHTKIIGVKTIDDKCFLVEGSGNMTGNARIEQYMIEQSKEMYKFQKSWINEIKQFDNNSVMIN